MDGHHLPPINGSGQYAGFVLRTKRKPPTGNGLIKNHTKRKYGDTFRKTALVGHKVESVFVVR